MADKTLQVNTRDAFLDIAKGIGILLVILGHTYGIPDALRKIIYAFHMPLFFMISGYVYNEEKYRSFSFKKMLTLKAKRYLIPFYVFAGVNLAIALLWNLVIKHIPITLEAIKDYILGILYCYADMRYMPNCSPIWFLMTLFIGGMVFWAIMKCSKKIRPVLAVALLAVSYLLYLFVDFRLPLNLAPTGAAVFFMYAGYLLKRYNVLNYKVLLLLVIPGVFAAFMNPAHLGMNENVYGNFVFFIVAALSLSVCWLISCKWISKYKNPVNRFLVWMGKNAMMVVGFNYFMRDFTTEAYYLVPVIRNYPIHWTVSFTLITVGCVVMILFWNKLKNGVKQRKEKAAA